MAVLRARNNAGQPAEPETGDSAEAVEPQAVSGEAAGEEVLQPVPIVLGKRGRGRPKKQSALSARRQPAVKAVPRTFKCLACDSQAKLPAEELPVYCRDCYPSLILEG